MVSRQRGRPRRHPATVEVRSLRSSFFGSPSLFTLLLVFSCVVLCYGMSQQHCPTDALRMSMIRETATTTTTAKGQASTVGHAGCGRSERHMLKDSEAVTQAAKYR